MAEHCITFPDLTVRAILAGTKTQVRRIITPKPFKAVMLDGKVDWRVRAGLIYDTDWVWPLGPGHHIVSSKPGPHPEWVQKWVKFATGDLLRAKEAFWRDEHGIRYRASGHVSPMGWRPATNMPRELERIALRITEVRLQKVQDITEEDAKAEGSWPPTGYKPGTRGDFIGGFAFIWESIHGTGAWDANDWVVAISFQREDAA